MAEAWQQAGKLACCLADVKQQPDVGLPALKEIRSFR
jgi:hypothetical protein